MRMVAKDLVRQAATSRPGRQVRRQLSRITFGSSESYWESRYRGGGNSGSGSYGRLAKFKADVLNEFVAKSNVSSVVEFGCGDGNQLSLAEYPSYLGIDVSPTAIGLCKGQFGDDPTKRFLLLNDFEGDSGDLTLSLDVIYHLVEDDIFYSHIDNLFRIATRFVIIYSSNFEQQEPDWGHVRHRRFTDTVGDRWPTWRQMSNPSTTMPTRHPSGDSLAEFHFFERDVAVR